MTIGEQERSGLDPCRGASGACGRDIVRRAKQRAVHRRQRGQGETGRAAREGQRAWRKSLQDGTAGETGGPTGTGPGRRRPMELGTRQRLRQRPRRRQRERRVTAPSEPPPPETSKAGQVTGERSQVDNEMARLGKMDLSPKRGFDQSPQGAGGGATRRCRFQEVCFPVSQKHDGAASQADGRNSDSDCVIPAPITRRH